MRIMVILSVLLMQLFLGATCSWPVYVQHIRRTVGISQTQALLLLTSPFILTSSAGLHIFAIMSGFNYGEVLVVYVGSVARIWGADKVDSIYGWLFSANIPGEVAPLFVVFFYDITSGFTIPLYFICTIIFVAIVTLSYHKDSFAS